MIKKLTHTAIAGIGAVLLLSGGAQAATMVATIDGNDCAGVWGKPFEDCKSPDEYGASPIIAKFDADGTTSEFNSLFGSVDGSEFDVSISGDTVEWTYTPGTDDPIITVVTLKYGPMFDVWYADGASILSGMFSTADGKDISHVSFYDSDGDDPGGFEIPVPASLPLLLAGLGGLGVMSRRKTRKSA